VDTLSVDERHTSFSTVPLTKKTYEEVSNLFDEIRAKILDDATESEDADRIYNMVLQLYPVSKDLHGE
jgi:hypothetical protein